MHTEVHSSVGKIVMLVELTGGAPGSSYWNKYVLTVRLFPFLMDVDSSTKSDRRLDSFV